MSALLVNDVEGAGVDPEPDFEKVRGDEDHGNESNGSIHNGKTDEGLIRGAKCTEK